MKQYSNLTISSMDSEDIIKKYSLFIKNNILPLALGLIGLIFLGYGLIALVGSSDSSKEIIFEPGSDSSLSSDTLSKENKASNIVVDVEGAVLKPGIYTLAVDSRVSEALIAAGGLSEFADRDWLEKNLNLAVKLSDGAKVYIPRRGEADTESIKGITPLRQGFAGQAGIAGSTASDQININTASVEMLDSLPGIGPVTAGKIINGRPYASIDELLERKIVNSKVFEQVREKVTVY